jgi:hypothetical protein
MQSTITALLLMNVSKRDNYEFNLDAADSLEAPKILGK